ncbi:amidohydrolase family protein [Sphingomonas morindae]|uniref:Amidohydrolase family protein n=1 Tax=Sphingomonas morindae TaxID=1541170 RepID=A0ABY4XDA3_9SPHN|nr:amidohydrolase family protein [Sphingomonas morindae]USI74824.1 amidohydrolase family protein [Sphingomonas morindae]
MLIDAHLHLWSLGHAWHAWPTAALPRIHRDVTADEAQACLAAHGVEAAVLVQAQPSRAETDWLAGLAARLPWIAGVVGWEDLAAPDAPARIAARAADPWIKGLRPMMQDLAPDWMLQPALAPAFAAMAAHGLVLDALIRPAHLPALAELAARHPDLAIVIDHGAKPDIAGRAYAGWADDMARLAAQPQLACKLSGLVTEAAADWRTADLAEPVGHLYALFGPDRLLWGSDWPVLLLAGDYGGWLAAARALIPEPARAAVFGGTAARLYRLG